MVVDQFVERVEFYHPQKEFPLGIAKYFEVLDTIATSARKKEKT
jgi:hypothetical protein